MTPPVLPNLTMLILRTLFIQPITSLGDLEAPQSPKPPGAALNAASRQHQEALDTVKKLVITCHWQVWLIQPGGATLKGLGCYMPKPHQAIKLPKT